MYIQCLLIVFELKLKAKIRTYIRFDFFDMRKCSFEVLIVFFHVVGDNERGRLEL